MEDSSVEWRKSTRCGSSACVEVALGKTVDVRDGKQLHHHDILQFDREVWQNFVNDLKKGQMGA